MKPQADIDREEAQNLKSDLAREKRREWITTKTRDPMTTKYTPGPWVIANESYCPQTNRSGYRIESTTAGGIVCDVIHTGHFAADNPEAHADLIAAAPELAEALKACLTAIDVALKFEGDVFGVHHNDTQDALQIARHALQKAGLVS